MLNGDNVDQLWALDEARDDMLCESWFWDLMISGTDSV